MHISLKPIDALSSRELLQILKLRLDVFVVEQGCAYADIDAADTRSDTLHLAPRSARESDPPIACARLIAPRHARDVVRIGRMAVHPGHRGKGLARQMLLVLIERAQRDHQQHALELAAQTHALSLYRSAGFEVCSATYLDDGIEHVDMRYAMASP